LLPARALDSGVRQSIGMSERGDTE